MSHRFVIYFPLAMVLVLSACVTKEKYTELQIDLNAQIKQRDEALSSLQNRYTTLEGERDDLLKRIDGLKLELSQARDDIRLKSTMIQDLTLNLGKSQSTIRQRDMAITDLRRNLGLAQALVREKENRISELDDTRKEIESSLREQIAEKDIKIEEIEGKLRVTFVDKILFDSGSTRIKSKGQEVLLKLAESFGTDANKTIVVEGHTDNVDIGYPLKERFPSNWELSTARAASVVRFLQDKGNISPERMTASGFSYYRPVATNDTKENRRQNRRIEIILVPPR